MMGPSRQERELCIAAARLAIAAPNTWEKFLHELRLHADRGKDALVTSPSATLHYAQGRAAERADFLNFLATCVVEANKLGTK